MMDSRKQNIPIHWPDIFRANFVERPNRFLIRCKGDSRETFDAFLPNSGRLWELLIPNALIYLVPSSINNQSLEKPKIPFTAIAIDFNGTPIFTHTHASNKVAAWLLENRMVPGLEKAEIIRPEYSVGNCRFDFLMQEERNKFLLEVKTVTLFANQTAMFPDAITERGRRHLLELAEMSRPESPSTVLFLVQYANVDWFMPDYHTDLAFSQAFLSIRDRVRILPIAIKWNAKLAIVGKPKLLDVPWDFLEIEIADRGAYLLILTLDKPESISIGGLGIIDFAPGHYVYVGSAMANLSARIERHLRKRKNMHWHVDYLRRHAARCVALPIRASKRQECQIFEAFSTILQSGPKGFGCSDCQCPTHLLYSATNPLHNRAFYDALFRFRIPFPP